MARLPLAIQLVVLIASVSGANIYADASFVEKCSGLDAEHKVCRSFSAPSAYYGSLKFECTFFDSESLATEGYEQLVQFWSSAENAKLVELDFYFGQQAAGIRFRETEGIVGILLFRIEDFACVWSYRGGVDPFLFSTFENLYFPTIGSQYSSLSTDLSRDPMGLIPDEGSVPFEMTLTSQVEFGEILPMLGNTREVWA